MFKPSPEAAAAATVLEAKQRAALGPPDLPQFWPTAPFTFFLIAGIVLDVRVGDPSYSPKN